MRRTTTLAGALVAAATLSGCWVQPGFDAGRSHWNAGETTITAADVDELAAEWSAAGSPVATYGDVVVVRDDLAVSGLDAATGDVRWTVDVPGVVGLPGDVNFTIGSIAVAGGKVLVPVSYISQGGSVVVDPVTGEATGSFGGTVEQHGLPAVVGDRAVAISIARFGISGLTIGSISWSYQPTFILDPGSPWPGGSFAVVGDRIAWSQGDEATGFSPACPPYPSPAPSTWCQPDWRTDLGAAPTAVAALGPDQAIYTDAGGTVTVLDVATGAVAWTAELGAAASPPGVVGPTSFVGAGGQLAAFPAAGCGAVTCSPSWTAPGGAVIAGGDVVYTASGGDVVAYPAGGCGAATCEPLATLTVEGTDVTPQIVDGGRLLAATGDGRTVAFGLP